MSERYMLDTNMVSYIVTGRSAAARSRLANLANGAIACVSTITEAELRYGLAKTRKPQLQSSIDWLLARLQVLPWRSEEARVYGRVRARQEELGKPLESLDMLIAAHALTVGAVLVTRDMAFHQVEGLSRIENWSTDV